MSDDLGFVSTRSERAQPPADPRTVAPRVCPGLALTESSITWIDSRGAAHDLLRERRYSPCEAARLMGRSTEWVLRKIRAGELYPTCRYNLRTIEIWQCGLEDYVARHLGSGGKAA